MIQSLLRCVIGVWRLDDCTNANYGLLRISSIDCYRYKNNYTPLAASSMQLSFRGVRIVFACVRPLTLQKQSLRPRCHCGYHCEAMSPESVSVGALASLSAQLWAWGLVSTAFLPVVRRSARFWGCGAAGFSLSCSLSAPCCGRSVPEPFARFSVTPAFTKELIA